MPALGRLVAALGTASAAGAAWPELRKPLRCPEGPGQPWTAFAAVVEQAWASVQVGQLREATVILSDALDSVTGDLARAHDCSLGFAAAYRVLAIAHVANPELAGRARVRALQVGLRFMHLSSNWLTHAFVGCDHETQFIDNSVWPITLQESADEHRWTTTQLAEGGRAAGHRARAAGVPHDYRHPGLSIAIVSLCAYPEGHVLPRFAMSNHRFYAERHGYFYHVRTERTSDGRPPAWGKVQLVLELLEQRRWDWVMWADCDVYFMNMSTTLDSILFRYGAAKGAAGGSLQLDPEFQFLVTEDHAMLNTGIFLARTSTWSAELMRRIWGPQDSVWTHHPWWEQAAMAWDFWAELPRRFRGVDHQAWVASAGLEADEMDGIYPAPVRLAPQGEFNSYHPVTSRLVADTWLPGKFVIAFNGVVSSSSPNVASELYGRYYELSCKLNAMEHRCLQVPPFLPWLRRGPPS
mmetsp:Transcript_60947/g.181585  ORF Transcript_60947/g.181585 Transcript_60947/m.181585 type:complete len:466 (-) Transcript_60947:82-1479(-)